MSRSIPPSSEDVSVELTRAVLPTYLHHVLDASETLADFALERLAGNETARRELETQIETQRETCAAPVSIHKAAQEKPGGPFARRDEALSPGARAAKRAADNAKLADLERARRAAVAEAGEIEVRLRVAEDAAAALRGAPRELRAVTRLLGDVMADLEADAASDDDDDGGAFPPRAPLGGVGVFGPVRRVRGPREPGGHRDGGGHSGGCRARGSERADGHGRAGHGGGARRRRRRRRAPEPRAAVPRGGGQAARAAGARQGGSARERGPRGVGASFVVVSR